MAQSCRRFSYVKREYAKLSEYKRGRDSGCITKSSGVDRGVKLFLSTLLVIEK